MTEIDRKISQTCAHCTEDIGWEFRTQRWERIGMPGYQPDRVTCPGSPERRHEPKPRTLLDGLVQLHQGLCLAVEDRLRDSRILEREAPAGPWERGSAHGKYDEAVRWRDRVASLLAQYPNDSKEN